MMDNKTILFFSPIDPIKQKGGIPRVVSNQIDAIKTFCPDTEVIVIGRGVENLFYQENGVQVYTVTSIINFIQTLKKILKNHPMPLVVSHDWIFSFIGAILIRKCYKLFTVHDPWTYHVKMVKRLSGTPWYFFLGRFIPSWIVENFIYVTYNKIVAISDFTKERIPKFVYPKLEVVYNWVPDKDFYIYSEDEIKKLKESYGVDGLKTVFFIRGLYPASGISHLVAALKYINNDTAFIIVGDGELKAWLQSEIKKDMPVKIVYLSSIKDKDLLDLYNMADLLVRPSVDNEGFGLPVVEALLCGTPVISSIYGALSIVNKSIYGGFVNQIEDSEEFATAINNFTPILFNDRLKERSNILKYFSINIQGVKFNNLIRRK